MVVDDAGGLSKIVSCENSFRRGTMKTKENIHSALLDLYHRLPRLVQHRIAWSTEQPELAHPTTLVLTVRLVVSKDHPAVVARGSRRPFLTKRKQCKVNGRNFVQLSLEAQAKFLQHHVEPLLQATIFSLPSFDVTRISLALSNFQDVVEV